MQQIEFIKKNTAEAKQRIKKSILKDHLIIFFTRILEDLKKHNDPNLFGRTKNLYILINPYSDYHKHKIYRCFKKELFSDDGMTLDEQEKKYIKIFFKELKRDFHLKNPKIMKGRINGILNKLSEKYLPNSTKIIEPFILGRIISAVGGIENLYKMPSSTIQLIGAENSLFRHISKKTKPPKYGLIYYSKNLQQQKQKGKYARRLANKIAISIKVDYFQKLNSPMMKRPFAMC